jgi:membrane-associated protein
MGPKVLSGKHRFLKKEYLDKTQSFYDKYGVKTIVIARFVPIVRTFAPFMAGVGSMNYGRFFAYNVIGALIWVLVCCLAGYFFGNIPAVKKNFGLVVIGIIFVSVLPIAIEILRTKFSKKKVIS